MLRKERPWAPQRTIRAVPAPSAGIRAHVASYPRAYPVGMSEPPTGSCNHCRRYTYQPCYVAGVFTMSPHCFLWSKCFPDASRCTQFEREPGSDDELS
jgi:hypothetical protein